MVNHDSSGEGGSFYQKALMEHYKKPRHKKNIEDPDFTSGHDNPSCGDKVIVKGKITDGSISDIGFDGSGCVISIASASMLMDKCKGMSIEDVLALTKDDILKMIQVELGPNRLHCALLSLEALQRALSEYKEKEG